MNLLTEHEDSVHANYLDLLLMNSDLFQSQGWDKSCIYTYPSVKGFMSFKFQNQPIHLLQLRSIIKDSVYGNPIYTELK